MALSASLTATISQEANALTSGIDLGSAASFAVLAGSGITNTGATYAGGSNGADFGSTPTPAFTGYGTVYNGPSTKYLTVDPVTTAAKGALDSAYADAASRIPDFMITTSEIGGETLSPGVYQSGNSIVITGDLILDAENNPGAVFIFQAPSSTLVTAVGSRVILIRGAQAGNVFWQVGSSATLGVDSDFSGHVLANTSITVNTRAIIRGQLLAKGGAVTLDTNTFINDGVDLTHTVTFNKSDGSGSTSTQSSPSAATLTANVFARSGFTFMSWNTVADGSGISYADGASYDFSADDTFYAQWAAAPEQVTDLAGSAGTTTGEINLTWTAPDANGSAITGYTVQYRLEGTGLFTTVADTDGSNTDTQATILGLDPDTAYDFRVLATNAMGSGDVSTAIDVTTAVAAPEQVTDLAGSAGTTTGEINLTWTAPDANGSAITGYTVQYRLEGTGLFTTVADTDGSNTDTQATILGLDPNTAYDFRVLATNAMGSGDVSTAIDVTTAVAAPEQVTDLAGSAGTTTGEINLTWTAPDANGSAITGYTVQYRLEGTGLFTTVADTDGSNTDTQATILGLDPNTAYDFRVLATNAMGSGDVSTAIDVTTAVAAPEQVTDLAGSAGTTTGEINLTWTAPDANGSAITGYTVQYRLEGTGLFTTVADTDGSNTDTQATILGLDPNTAYDFRVLATNAEGSGDVSTAIDVTTSSASVPGTSAAQTITYAQTSTQKLSSHSVTVTPTSSSGLAVSLASSTTGVCTVSGFVITFVSAGTCTTVASQAGGANSGITYAAASTITQAVTISSGPSGSSGSGNSGGSQLSSEDDGPVSAETPQGTASTSQRVPRPQSTLSQPGPATETPTVQARAFNEQKTSPPPAQSQPASTEGTRSPAQLQKESFSGFAPGSSVQVNVTGSRIAGQFVVVDGMAADRIFISAALKESADRRTSDFATILSVGPVSGTPDESAMPDVKITKADLVAFADAGLAEPRSVSDLNLTDANKWIFVEAGATTYVPGTTIYLVVTTTPTIFATAVVDQSGQANLQGSLPVDLLESGGHNIRVVGTRSIEGISADSHGELILDDRAMAMIMEFDEGTSATMRVVGVSDDGSTVDHRRVINLKKIVPWWTLWLALSIIALLFVIRLTVRRQNLAWRIISAVISFSGGLPAFVLGWLTASYQLWIAFALSAGMSIVFLLWKKKDKSKRMH